mmetsp:Transcript_23550/g.33032  ORF Transcript_23550/g.33032 Transcript_23550/m.33032 type:complete len:276 (-) Transcript_23550:104-931(-)
MLVLRHLQRRVVAEIGSAKSCSSRQYHVALRAATKRSAVSASTSSASFTDNVGMSNNSFASRTTTAPLYLQNQKASMSTDGLRAYPQFSVYGETCVLSIKMISPKFKVVKDGILVPDNYNRGRLLLEFTGREGSQIHWKDQVRFALDAAEVGLLVSQLPHHPVEWARQPGGAPSPYGMADVPDAGANTDMPDKVLSIQPEEGAKVKFTLDFVKDGVGGQDPKGPLEITAEAGEFEVMKSIMQSSLPFLSGWQTLMEVGSKADLHANLSQPGPGYY